LGLIPGFPTIGGPELIILLVIVLLLFGAKRIPELAKGLGSGVREFRQGLRGEEDEKKDEELTAGADKAGDSKDGPRVQEEAARAEGAGEQAERAERAERSEHKH
jgi:sec-independent protein translocase protein TatA